MRFCKQIKLTNWRAKNNETIRNLVEYILPDAS